MTNDEIRQEYAKEVGEYHHQPVEVETLTPAERRMWRNIIAGLIVVAFLCVGFSFVAGNLL